MSDQGGYAAGWYPNPEGGPGLRWYDGTQWTDDFHFDQGPAQQYAGQGWGTGQPGSAVHGYPGSAYGAPPKKGAWEYFMYVLTENYANFDGRARRAEYWWYTLFNTLIGFGLIIVAAILSAGIENPAPVVLVLLAWVLGMFIPSLAVTVRRLHDTNKSGWWLLIYFVPFGSLVIFIFLVIEGDRGPNQYGWPTK